MIILTASKSCLTASRRELLVEGAVNVNIVQFVFSSDWDGLTKTAVFQAGSDKYSVLLDESNEAPIPWEVLQNPRRTLYAGVYGTNGESLVLPTIWTSLGIIQEGASPGENTQPPTPDVYSQILAAASKAEEIAQSVRDDADSGAFDGPPGASPYIGENGNWFVGSVDTGVRAQGGPGAPGKTPERGVDYWTEADKQEIVSEVLEQVPSGSEIDDTAVSAEKTWSSKNIVEKLAPAFESSGPVVTCNPVKGYPLNVVSQIVAVQGGTGDPSPENVRPISGWDAANLWVGGKNLFDPGEAEGTYRIGAGGLSTGKVYIKDVMFSFGSDSPAYEPYQGQTITLPFGQTVYGGTLNWTTGVLTIHFKYLELNSAYDYYVYDHQSYPKGVSCNVLDARYNLAEAICSHGECMQKFVSDKPSYFWIGVNNPDVYWIGIMDELGFNSLEEFKSWLDTQDVQIVYKTQNPITIQLTQQEILALSGTNTIYTDTGDTTVSGRADPNTIIQQLAARIAALEGAATNL